MFRQNIDFLEAQQKQIKEDNARLSGVNLVTETNKRGWPLSRQVLPSSDGSTTTKEEEEALQDETIMPNTTNIQDADEDETPEIIKFYNKLYCRNFKKDNEES